VLPAVGGYRSPAQHPALRPSGRAEECAAGNTLKPVTAVMRGKISVRRGMLTLIAAGEARKAVGAFMGCSQSTVGRWIQRSIRTDDLGDLPRAGHPVKYTAETALKVVAFYCQIRPLSGCGRWSIRWAAAYLAAHPGQVNACPGRSAMQRILRDSNLKPHLSAYFLQITDPDFFPKMEHLLALYKDPPSNLYFFDECPGIQILKRLAPDLRTNEMKKRLEEFEYMRNGTMDVLAFLNHADGKVYAECRRDHATSTFLEVFRMHVALAPASEPLLGYENALALCRELCRELCRKRPQV
jgi:hypothetical protein